MRNLIGLGLLVFWGFSSSCLIVVEDNSAGKPGETIAVNPEVPDTLLACSKVFQPNRIFTELVPSFSAKDIVAVEKCGFTHRPSISFYSELLTSDENPIPALMSELREREDKHWIERVVFLTKAVIERGKFDPDVATDRDLIRREVLLAFNRLPEGEVRERVRGLKDGIDMYFLTLEQP